LSSITPCFFFLFFLGGGGVGGGVGLQPGSLPLGAPRRVEIWVHHFTPQENEVEIQSGSLKVG
jgi:hypothetical protein